MADNTNCTSAGCSQRASRVVRLVDNAASVYPVCDLHAQRLLESGDYEELDEITDLWVWPGRN